MDQIFFNWVLGLGSITFGIILKAIWDSVRDLRAADSALTDKVAKIEVIVAGEYVKRDDLDKIVQALFTKLDRIEQRFTDHIIHGEIK